MNELKNDILEDLSNDSVKSLVTLEIAHKKGLIKSDVLQKAKNSIIKESLYEYGSVDEDDVVEIIIDNRDIEEKIFLLNNERSESKQSLVSDINNTINEIRNKPLDIDYITEDNLLNRKINIIFILEDSNKTETVNIVTRKAQDLIREKQAVISSLISDLCVH